MKKIKKILSCVLSVSMLLGSMSVQSFAQENEEQTKVDLIENNKEYLVPIDICSSTGVSIEESGTTDTIANFVDNAALVKKNDDGTYHVTLQLENYEK